MRVFFRYIEGILGSAGAAFMPKILQMPRLQKRLLFVDDERAIRETLQFILKRYGYAVTLASTISEALEQIQKEEFDILLCDLNVEREGDGYNVIRAMQVKDPHCHTIVLTGFPSVESAIAGVRLHIDDYLIKPTNANELVALLAERFTRRQTKPRIERRPGPGEQKRNLARIEGLQ